MNPADVRAGTRSAWMLIGRLGLQEGLSTYEPLPVHEGFRDAALDPDARYERVYLTGLENSHYNFIMADYSYFQFSCRARNEYRFAYLPNPFLSPTSAGQLNELREYVDEGVISLDDYLHRISEMRAGQHPPMLRYENSPSQYRKHLHPQSHFHIGHHSDNRWPLERELTVTAFVTLIMKHFYSSYWNDDRHIDSLSGTNELEDLLAAEKAGCRLVPVEHFTNDERAQFFQS